MRSLRQTIKSYFWSDENLQSEDRLFLLAANNSCICSMTHLQVAWHFSTENKRLETRRHTTAAVISRHIPDPPPVTNTTLPLKMLGRKTEVESTTGATNGARPIDIVGTLKKGAQLLEDPLAVRLAPAI